MSDLLLGVETEYALVGPECVDGLLQRLTGLLGERTRHLAGGNLCDMFLENGSRFYVDCGGHPEMSTPECSSPCEVVRYLQAGEALLADIVTEMNLGNAAAPRTMLFRCNVDYSGARTTWGSHESYLHRAEPKHFPDQLIPHLVSRVIYTGAGGFNPLSSGLEFTLSPRSWHLRHEMSAESTNKRGIFHTKDEALSRNGNHRLHLICGESLCSELAIWLRVGTTALIVALVDAGLEPGAGVHLRHPLDALRAFVRDASCRSKGQLADGRRVTASEIQRHYLEEVERQLPIGWLPSWAETVCREWRTLLDRIEHGPEALSGTLDWSIKHAVYRNIVERAGLAWKDLPAWNHMAEVIASALKRSEFKGERTIEVILDRTSVKSPIRSTIKSLTPYLEEHALSWDMLRPFWNLKKELFEVDVRFGQIGDDGIFNSLDQAGVLNHRLPGMGSVDRARTRPPGIGRARLRSAAIRRYSGRPGFECYWDHIRDLKGGRIMDLSDPFASRVKWKKMPRSRLANERLRRRMSRMISEYI